MSTYYLAAPVAQAPPAPPPPPRPVYQIPKLTLESMSGAIRIPLDSSTGWTRMPGSTGLEMPPFDLISGTIPGVAGAVSLDERTQSRPVFIPIYANANGDHLDFLKMKDDLRSLVDPLTGTFRIVGTTARGERELVVTYVSGLEGADGNDVEGQTWGKYGLNAIAYSPYATAREDTTLEFSAAITPTAFLGVAGGTDTPWPAMLTASSVIGSGMIVSVGSEVPVYPVLELVGPMTSFEGDLSPTIVEEDGTITTLTDQTWYVNIPLGVPAGQTFRLVTDPRFRSARLEGALASGRVALGSSLRPFYPGRNVLNVVASGSTTATRIRLSWRELHRSLW